MMRNFALIKPQSAIRSIKINRRNECNIIEFDLFDLIASKTIIAENMIAKITAGLMDDRE
ncbi:MAG: hypothetical protein J0L55_09710 [Caulobacterales bacterium]|nr:hypothetical protein [Caulobacterales bacterium]